VLSNQQPIEIDFQPPEGTGFDGGVDQMPCKTEEIGNVLRSDESLQSRIVRSLGNFTVALLAISDYPERLDLAGTGTVVMIDGTYYILTARHVWEECQCKIDWKFNLHGVAFCQLGIGENPATIRCHGPESVRTLLRTSQGPLVQKELVNE
jgi:hypothetical protein